MSEERRWRLIYLDVGTVMGFLNWKQHECVNLPVLEGLPEDYWIKNVSFSWERNAFCVIISHPSFGPVPPGECIPQFGGEWSVKREAVMVNPPAGRTITIESTMGRVNVGAFDAGTYKSETLPEKPLKKGCEFLGAP